MIESLKTERLEIRLIEKEDYQAIKQIWEDFNRSQYVIYDCYKNTDSEDVKERIARWSEASRNGEEHVFYVACLDGKVIGFISLNKCFDENEIDYTNQYEIGYGFLDEFHGMGYARESLSAVFEALKNLGVNRITAGTALKNIPSYNLLEGLGFKMLRTEKVSFFKDENDNDIVFDGGIFEKILV